MISAPTNAHKSSAKYVNKCKYTIEINTLFGIINKIIIFLWELLTKTVSYAKLTMELVYTNPTLLNRWY